jgi:N-acetylmuramoyl-L-alanine amidase
VRENSHGFVPIAVTLIVTPDIVLAITWIDPGNAMRLFVALTVLIALGMITFGLIAGFDDPEQSSNPQQNSPTTVPEVSESTQSAEQAMNNPNVVSGNFDDSDNRCFRGETGVETPVAGRTIIVDPGHGGEDLGTVNPTYRLTESDLVLRISRDLRDRLIDSGANVCLTRTQDIYVELIDRAEFANEMDGDVFLSVHLNSLPNPNENYTMTMWGNEAKDRYLSEVLLERLRFGMAEPAYHLGNPNPMTPDVYRLEDLDSTMLRTAEMPATLVEASFLSNTWEARAFIDGMSNGSRWREHQIADILHSGLLDYFESFE